CARAISPVPGAIMPRRYQDALALNPGRADIRLKLGDILKELARFDEAEAAYRRAAALAPRDRAAHLQLGDLLTLMGRSAEGRRLTAPPLRSCRCAPISASNTATCSRIRVGSPRRRRSIRMLSRKFLVIPTSICSSV